MRGPGVAHAWPSGTQGARYLSFSFDSGRLASRLAGERPHVPRADPFLAPLRWSALTHLAVIALPLVWVPYLLGSLDELIERAGALEWTILLATSLFVGLLGLICLVWVVRLPRLWRRVHELVEKDRPVRMALEVIPDGQRARAERTAVLVGARGERLSIPLGSGAAALGRLNPPAWLLQAGAWGTVGVHGAEGSGPYLLELADGRTALLQP